ncbi:MAG: thioredoxin domain-containing protein [Cytophagaceae bacterium]|nr:thioredoxin domain-containing protein [Cytophagaceae bacterium]
MSNKKDNPNRLIKQTSPYLLQHAYNPVDWYPWGEEALKKAKEEDKPIIMSIGYSACHWCHVMERESFENEEIASLMNKLFVNIKVDREERPDVDQIYMDALHSMNIQGGWPLNVFLMPDAKPFYGGTYFPPSHWIHLLNQIGVAFKDQREALEKSAEDFTRVLNYSEVYKYGLEDKSASFTKEDLDEIFPNLEKKFDKRLGGTGQAPKFMMPSIYLFLLRHYHTTKNESALQHVKLTLDKMAYGGIYDQIGGGFARYSTDAEWFAPHFEKMLYDNGQLLSLYSEAYTITQSELYKNIVYETIEWLGREMINPEGGFYSALDADSEGEEGKFYIWTDKEIDKVLKKDAPLFKEYYNMEANGNWEHDYNILHRKLSDLAFANKHNIEETALTAIIRKWKQILLEKRNQRIKPGLDDKILTSWNGIMLKGLVDAYRIFDEPLFLELAEKNAQFMKNKIQSNDKLFHSYKNGKASIDGYLEDYAFVIQGYIALYQATFNEAWLLNAKNLTQYVMDHFYDKEEQMFFFTADNSEKLIARKKELFDNVIPGSNSVMATNLYWLSIYFEREDYLDIALSMLAKIKKLLIAEPSYTSNWGSLFTYQVNPTAEIVISGKSCLEYRKQLDKHFLPNKILAGTKDKSSLSLLEGREPSDGKTMVYVCYNKTCQVPADTIDKAMKTIK